MLRRSLYGKIIQCHIDYSDAESFVVGQLVYFDSNWFLMQDISPNGYWNGLALYKRSDIVAVDTATDYLDRIVTLVNYRSELVPLPILIPSDPLKSLLTYARDSMRVVGFELHASGYRNVNGTIDSFGNQVILVNQLDEFGRHDGKSYISIDSITRCYLDDEESRCLEILASNREEKACQ